MVTFGLQAPSRFFLCRYNVPRALKTCIRSVRPKITYIYTKYKAHRVAGGSARYAHSQAVIDRMVDVVDGPTF